MISLLQKNRAKKQVKKNYKFEPCIFNECINVPKPSVEVGEGGVVRDVVDQEDASRLSKIENFDYTLQRENHFYATLRRHL